MNLDEIRIYLEEQLEGVKDSEIKVLAIIRILRMFNQSEWPDIVEETIAIAKVLK